MMKTVLKKVMIGLLCTSAAITLGFNLKDILQQEKRSITISGIMPEPRSEEEMILDSDLIVEGTVSDILPSKWSNKNFERGEDIRNILQTDIVIDVDNVLYGDISGDNVKVRINKGEDANTIVHSEGYPDFFENENVLLFLSRDDSDVATDEDYYVLTGMKQGKYSISEYGMTALNSDLDSGALNINNLAEKIKQVYESNPDYKEEKAIRQKEIKEQNELLFGE